MCDFCEHGAKHPLLTCKFNNIGITIKIINKTQLDGGIGEECQWGNNQCWPIKSN